MTCHFCNCSHFNPCIDDSTGWTCMWVDTNGWVPYHVCSFCAERPDVQMILDAYVAHRLAQVLPKHPPQIQAAIAQRYEELR